MSDLRRRIARFRLHPDEIEREPEYVLGMTRYVIPLRVVALPSGELEYTAVSHLFDGLAPWQLPPLMMLTGDGYPMYIEEFPRRDPRYKPQLKLLAGGRRD